MLISVAGVLPSGSVKAGWYLFFVSKMKRDPSLESLIGSPLTQMAQREFFRGVRAVCFLVGFSVERRSAASKCGYK
jgi:hypothetical protein